MEIRKAKIEDFEKLLNLVHQLSPKKKDDLDVDMGVLKKIIHDENHELYVAEIDGELVGTGMLILQMNLSHGGKPTGHIENIVVNSWHRKKGIGKKIIDFLIELAKKKKCYKVILNCKKENILFYKNCGTKESGEVEMRLDIK